MHRGLEDGSKLRVDTTVVETDIHHPTDNTLLWDVVRVLTRLLGRLAKALGLRRIAGFRNRSRAAHRRMYEIQRMTTRQRQGKGSRQTATYRALISIAEEVVGGARRALDDTAAMRAKDPLIALKIEALRDEIVHYCDLGTRVIEQARRRVLDGEQVPTSEKVYSIFEPHTDLIKRGKVRTPVEFGHKVFLAESARGLVTQYKVLKGNPSDEVHVAPSLRLHRRAFRRAPHLYGADRGFFSEQNVAACVHGAVETVCIPQRGGTKTPQRQAYEKWAHPSSSRAGRSRSGSRTVRRSWAASRRGWTPRCPTVRPRNERYLTPGSSGSNTSFTAEAPGPPKQSPRPSTKHKVRWSWFLRSQIVPVTSAQYSQIQFAASPQDG